MERIYNSFKFPNCIARIESSSIMLFGQFYRIRPNFHEDDRDSQSQSQNEEGSSRLSIQVISLGFRHNLPH